MSGMSLLVTRKGLGSFHGEFRSPGCRAGELGGPATPRGKSRREDQRREKVTQTPILFTCMEGHVFL